MTGAWVVVALLAPPAAAALAAIYLRPRNPSPWMVTGLNAALPGAGLAAAGRSTLEVVLGVEVRGRSHVLRINYRTTEQIRRAADQLLGNETDDMDSGTERRDGTRRASCR